MVMSRCFGIRILVDCVTLFKDIIPGGFVTMFWNKIVDAYTHR